MQTRKYRIIGGLIFVLGSLLFFSGCTEKTKENELNREKVMNSQAPTNASEVTVNESQSMITPDPGNSVEGKAIKEVDALLGTVSTDEYSADSLDENVLLAE